jgi:hypothetical protein
VFYEALSVHKPDKDKYPENIPEEEKMRVAHSELGRR